MYEIEFYLAPSTPVVFEREQYIEFAVNGAAGQVLNTVKQPEIPFFLSRQWDEEARNNIKIAAGEVQCKEGLNTLRFYAASPAIVLERIVLKRRGCKLPESYLGPAESFISFQTEA